MIELLIAACLSSASTECRDFSLLYDPYEMSLISCTLHGQQHIAQWRETHPEWTVVALDLRLQGARQRRHLSRRAAGCLRTCGSYAPPRTQRGRSYGHVAEGQGRGRHRIELGDRARHRRGSWRRRAPTWRSTPSPTVPRTTRSPIASPPRAACAPIYVRADMAKGDDCRGLVAKAAAALGRVDILVNNAGIQHVAPIPDFPPETWDRIIAINLVLGLPHHRRRAAADARPGLGPDRQHRLGARPDRLAVQVGLRRRQARPRRPHQGGGARDRRGADHLPTPSAPATC